MSRIIEKVPSKLIEIEKQVCECSRCGCGNTKDMTEKPCPGPNCNGYWRIKTVTYNHTQSGYILVKCDCGEEVVCQGFTSTCKCGADYNWSGQRLASRSQWGEETGESYADIVASGDPFDEC
jgi:hypothetical protein